MFCNFNRKHYICTPIVAGMVKLVDTPDLGSGAARCEGSSPFTRTSKALYQNDLELFAFQYKIKLVGMFCL
jgi:hypothetical protein